MSTIQVGSVNSDILFIGTLLEHQGVDVLIKASPSIIEESPSSTFVIILTYVFPQVFATTRAEIKENLIRFRYVTKK